MARPVHFADHTSYLLLSWTQLGRLAFQLSQKLLTSKLAFDRLVALATGGQTAAKTLKDHLAIPRVSSLTISFYTNLNEHASTPVITESLGADVQGERILLFDDVNDTGATLKTARQYLALRGAASVTTATLITKAHTTFPSDYFAASYNHWVIFPTEIRETLTLLVKTWRSQKLSSAQIRARLLQIGFTPTQLNLFGAP